MSDHKKEHKKDRKEKGGKSKSKSSKEKARKSKEEKPVKVVVVFYSLYTHAWSMAQAIAEGAKEVPGVEVEVYQVAETLPKEVIEAMHATGAKEAMKDVPVINADREKMTEILKSADALVIGSGTRFGSASAQMKSFLDSLGQLWFTDALVGKVGSAFAGSASQHGGNETTLWSLISFLFHMGFTVVGLPYTCKQQAGVTELTGGSPYGSTYMTGSDGSRQVSDNEKAIARFQGKHVAETAKKAKLGATLL